MKKLVLSPQKLSSIDKIQIRKVDSELMVLASKL